MRKVEKTIVPRLPREIREKLKQGGTHKKHKKYQRKEKHRHREGV